MIELSPSLDKMNPRKYYINFVGDVMLGRLIDQLFPLHVHETSEANIVRSYLSSQPELRNYGPKSPWGSTLPLLLSSDLNIGNLETSATTYKIKWPNKMFNYRMHPANIDALKAARFDYVTLANNHTLDFSEEGLEETVQTVQGAGIAFAGAGLTHEEAVRPAVLHLRPSDKKSFIVHVWAAADHPSEWFNVPEFHHLDYSTRTCSRLKTLITEHEPSEEPPPALKIFSVHWGPNYSWNPSDDIQSLAHYLIDECGIDIIHGHSSHHIQGVEKYKGKLIIYGCGDFVDDYAVIPNFRNNLSAVWRVCVAEVQSGLELERLEVFPTRIQNFHAHQLEKEDADHEWTRRKFRELCNVFGTNVREELGSQGQIVIDL